MIRSFKNKGPAELWEKGRTGKIDAKMYETNFCAAWIVWMSPRCWMR